MDTDLGGIEGCESLDEWAWLGDRRGCLCAGKGARLHDLPVVCVRGPDEVTVRVGRAGESVVGSVRPVRRSRSTLYSVCCASAGRVGVSRGEGKQV